MFFFGLFPLSKYEIDLKLIFEIKEKFVVPEIIKLYSVIGQKMSKNWKIQNFDFPLFPDRLGQNTSISGLNVIKYHCGLEKKIH